MGRAWLVPSGAIPVCALHSLTMTVLAESILAPALSINDLRDLGSLQLVRRSYYMRGDQ